MGNVNVGNLLDLVNPANVVDLVQNERDRKKSNKNAKNSLDSSLAENEVSRKQILAEKSELQETKNNLIKKAIAKQKALLGSGGRDESAVSEQAVLSRLEKEIQDEYDAKFANLDSDLEKLNQKDKTLKNNYKKNKQSKKSLLSSFGLSVLKSKL